VSKAVQGWYRSRPGIYQHETGARIWSHTAPSKAGNQALQWEVRLSDGLRQSGFKSMSDAMRLAQEFDPEIRRF